MKICQTSTNGGTDGHSHGQIRSRVATAMADTQILVEFLNPGNFENFLTESTKYDLFTM